MSVYPYDSPIGRLLLASLDGELTFLGPLSFHPDWLEKETTKKDSVIESAIDWLDAYFRGKPYPISIPEHLPITSFQRKVYEALLTVPYGSTITYSELGKLIGSKGYRAIGNALHHNPLLIMIPCHRVIGKNGLGGYAAGIDNKRYLLHHEGCL